MLVAALDDGACSSPFPAGVSVMRRALASAGVLWIALAVAVMLTRRTVQRTSPAPFPGVDVNGCWSGICLLDLSLAGVPVALSTHENVVAGSVHFDEFPGTSYSLLQFTYAPDKPILLHLGTGGYVLEHDWRKTDHLVPLGELLRVMGPPVALRLVRRDVVLHYPGLEVFVYPAEVAGSRVRLNLDDAVVSLRVTDVEDGVLPVPAEAQSWRGFGVYGFEG